MCKIWAGFLIGHFDPINKGEDYLEIKLDRIGLFLQLPKTVRSLPVSSLMHFLI